MKYSLYLTLLIYLMLFGSMASCANQEPLNGTELSADDSTKTANIVSTAADAGTSEPRDPTTSPTSTPFPFPYLYERCTDFSINTHLDSPDIFAFWSIKDVSLFLTRVDGSLIETEKNIEYLSSVVSPDGAKLAYIQKSPRKLVIASSSGVTLQTYVIPGSWTALISWVSENRLFIEKRVYIGESRIEPGKLISFDLDTGEFAELFPDFPDIVPFVESYPHWEGNMTFLPNPMLEYTFYAVAGGGIVVWDLGTQKEIGHIFDWSNPHTDPVWGREGEWFIVNVPLAIGDDSKQYTNWEDELPYKFGFYDLFLVRVNGDIQRLSYFSTFFSSEITSLSLSPDETHLAFWIDTQYERKDPNWQLGILNISTGKVKIYCFSPGDALVPEAPIWSPSGQNLMVTKYNEYEFMDAEVFLIDLVSGEIYSFQESAVGLGWLSPSELPSQ